MWLGTFVSVPVGFFIGFISPDSKIAALICNIAGGLCMVLSHAQLPKFIEWMQWITFIKPVAQLAIMHEFTMEELEMNVSISMNEKNTDQYLCLVVQCLFWNIVNVIVMKFRY